jgi:hypothetical protein
MTIDIPEFHGKSHNGIMWRSRIYKYNEKTQSLNAWNDKKHVIYRNMLPIFILNSQLCAKTFL